MDAKEAEMEALRRFRAKANCSQAVLGALSKGSGTDEGALMRLASGFGGGMARTGEVCGAVVGAVMVLGLRMGSTDPGDKEAKDRLYGAVERFITEFKERNGSIICRVMTGVDLMTPEGRQALKEQGIEREVCEKAVVDAADLLVGILKDNRVVV